MAVRQFTLEEVAKHNTEADCWLAIHGRVFNVTAFLAEHPGGKKVVLKEAGKDATAKFDAFHKPDVLLKYGAALYVGDLSVAPPAAKAAPDAPAVSAGAAGRARRAEASGAPAAFGELVPHGDPSWYQEWHSPYYTDSHRRFRAAMREFVEREMMPHCHEWDEARQLPRELYTKAFQAGWLPGVCGRPWPVDLAGSAIAGGVKPEEVRGCVGAARRGD